jgi:hypothetical protein
LKQATENILFSGDDYLKIKQGIDTLYDQFSERTGIEAGDLTFVEFIKAENGLSVALEHAAHCLKDLMRTTYFLRGIHQAIKEQLSNHSTVKILYAGCGPYATLLTPLTSQFSSDEVRFTMLDINPRSTESVRDLYAQMGLESYVQEYIVADATASATALVGTYDIIISETMAQALKVECQVPLTRNMIKHLNDSGTFIPQRITVDAYLFGKHNTMNPIETPKTFVGNVYNLDFKHVPQKEHKSVCAIPETEHDALMLDTTIYVYDSIVVKPYESGLTLPLWLKNLTDPKPKTVTFVYKEGISCDYEITYK